MIEIRQRQGNWRLRITGEEWSFNSLSEMQHYLGMILAMKGDFGRLPEREGISIRTDEARP